MKILPDPSDDEHDAMLKWRGRPFEPIRADISTLEAAVDLLARRWTPQKRAVAKSKA